MTVRTHSVARTATVLSRNPLGLLALCLVVGEAIASLFLLRGGGLGRPEAVMLCGFVVVYPLVVVCAIYRLVSRHHTHLYAPADFRDDRHFLEVLKLEVLQLTAPGAAPPSLHTPAISGDDFQLLVPAPAANFGPRREPGIYVLGDEAYYVTRRQRCFHLRGADGPRLLLEVRHIPDVCRLVARQHCDRELRDLADAADNISAG